MTFFLTQPPYPAEAFADIISAETSRLPSAGAFAAAVRTVELSSEPTRDLQERQTLWRLPHRMNWQALLGVL
jgi:hypothetical protein